MGILSDGIPVQKEAGLEDWLCFAEFPIGANHEGGVPKPAVRGTYLVSPKLYLGQDEDISRFTVKLRAPMYYKGRISFIGVNGNSSSILNGMYEYFLHN